MMSGIESVGDVGPSLFGSLASSIVSALSSLSAKVDAGFERVELEKKDEQGNIKVYNAVDHKTGKLDRDPKTDKPKPISRLTYIVDRHTGTFYLDEERWLIRVKCAAAFLFLSFYTTGVMCWNAVKTPLKMASIALRTFQTIAHKRGAGAVTLLGKGVVDITRTAGQGLWRFIRAPFYGFLCSPTLILGATVSPYRGRACEAAVEKLWQEGAYYRDDVKRIRATKGESPLKPFVRSVLEERPYFMAQCFQARGNLADKRIEVISRQPI